MRLVPITRDRTSARALVVEEILAQLECNPMTENVGNAGVRNEDVRPAVHQTQLLRIGLLEIDTDRLMVLVEGRPVPVDGLQLKLLLLLARHPDCVFTRERLLREVWGADGCRDLKTITVLICRL